MTHTHTHITGRYKIGKSTREQNKKWIDWWQREINFFGLTPLTAQPTAVGSLFTPNTINNTNTNANASTLSLQSHVTQQQQQQLHLNQQNMRQQKQQQQHIQPQIAQEMACENRDNLMLNSKHHSCVQLQQNTMTASQTQKQQMLFHHKHQQQQQHQQQLETQQQHQKQQQARNVMEFDVSSQQTKHSHLHNTSSHIQMQIPPPPLALVPSSSKQQATTATHLHQQQTQQAQQQQQQQTSQAGAAESETRQPIVPSLNLSSLNLSNTSHNTSKDGGLNDKDEDSLNVVKSPVAKDRHKVFVGGFTKTYKVEDFLKFLKQRHMHVYNHPTIIHQPGWCLLACFFLFFFLISHFRNFFKYKGINANKIQKKKKIGKKGTLVTIFVC